MNGKAEIDRGVVIYFRTLKGEWNDNSRLLTYFHFSKDKPSEMSWKTTTPVDVALSTLSTFLGDFEHNRLMCKCGVKMSLKYVDIFIPGISGVNS